MNMHCINKDKHLLQAKGYTCVHIWRLRVPLLVVVLESLDIVVRL